MMRTKFLHSALPLLLLPALLLFQSCNKSSIVDTREFELYYMGVAGIHPGEQINLSPSYMGEVPTSFRIFRITRNGEIHYNPKLDGELTEESTFFINPETGAFVLQKTTELKPAQYIVGISCKAGGKDYSYPEAISINVVKQQ